MTLAEKIIARACGRDQVTPGDIVTGAVDLAMDPSNPRILYASTWRFRRGPSFFESGGDGSALCSGDMLLEALVACAGVTMLAVATALSIPIRSGVVRAVGDLDFRGTLAVDKEVPVGFRSIRLDFEIDADATPEQLARLLQLTERYCVVAQTIRMPTPIAMAVTAA